MIVGVPREVKPREGRVALTPAGAHELCARGHRVLVERSAGWGSGIADAEYEAAGASIVSRADVFARAELILKVKDPLLEEADLLQPGQTLFCFLHLAALPELTRALLARRVTAIAYETVRGADGSLPLLAPMSAIAGRLAVQVGADLLHAEHGGRGVLLGGVPGVDNGEVVILGTGTVGMNALRMAVGLGARVTIIGIDLRALARIEELYGGRVTTLYSTARTIAEASARADLLVGAVLVPGARTPVLVTREMVRAMRPGAVIVDVAVDQGGCVETIRPTTHDDPTYLEEGVVHYGVTNMPGVVPRTSTFALTNATLPYVLALAEHGVGEALTEDPGLLAGLHTHDGHLVQEAVGAAHGLPTLSPRAALVPGASRREAVPAATSA